ncbi:hypothetical protein VHAB30_30020 [Variovorax boronicumulans]|nr:hypothetical protein VHAB30_30020 [Variovorax boronicumulans]
MEPGATLKPTWVSAFTPPKASVNASACSTGAVAEGADMEVSRRVSSGMAKGRAARSGFVSSSEMLLARKIPTGR